MKINITIIIIALCFFIVSPTYQCMASDYYLATYDKTSEGAPYNVSIKKANLETASIAESVVLRQGGCLLNQKPVILNFDDSERILIAIETGIYAKNTGPGPETTFVFILSDSLNIIRSREFPNTSVEYFKQIPGENGFRFALRSEFDTTMIYRRGLYNLDREFRFTRIRNFVSGLGPGDIRELDGFEYLDLFNNNPHNLYYSLRDSRYYFLRVDTVQYQIIATKAIKKGPFSKIFAYHPVTDKIYLFYLNYEQHGEFPQYEKDYGENWIDPYVLIYDPINFNLLDSLSVADFTPGNYPLGERGQADVVGDYIVYYFFNDEWIGRFNPAMLFIFDTRTNEATWLRVGWR